MDESTRRIHTILTPRNARTALVVIAVITAIMVFALRNAKLDYDFEKFFPTNDPELERYNAFRKKFGGDNDFLMIGIPREAGIYNVELLSKVDSLTSALERLDNIKKVSSPTRLTEPIITPIGVFQTPYLRFESDSTLTADSTRIAQDPRIHGTFFSEDGKAMLMLIDAGTGLSKLKSDALLKDVEQAIKASGLQDVQLAGRIHGQFHYIRMMLEELILFLTSAIVLLAIFLWWGFRSLWGEIGRAHV